MRDTIFALSSGALPAGVAVIRLSGPAAGSALIDMTGPLPPPRRLVLRDVRVGSATLDRALIVWMPAPGSFTGEDTAELHLHGSPALVRKILGELGGRHGLRLARPGEFTQRAFEAGKLDLVAADGLADLLGAETENQRRLAQSRFEGGLSERLEGWRERLLDLRAELEGALDFSDEGDVGEFLPPDFAERVADLARAFEQSADTYGRGRIIREGLRVVIAGPPNAGKSSLINALARSDIAIVTAEAGTTRDVREVPIDLEGQLVVLVDTAGLRTTDSLAEAEGIRRAHLAIDTADVVLWLQAPDVPTDLVAPHHPEVWTISSKADLGASAPGTLPISTLNADGLDPLLLRLTAFLADFDAGQSVLISHERDRQALSSAASGLREALSCLDRPEIAASLIGTATTSLDRLIGRVDPEHVLDALFSRFCIGK
ncbi:tRNA uridine-5-carboxymethylaminomethyl(34) synthesis GTPase MnmE [Devosia enhydra]|uniref:tRNA uridine-5-carboxymethylaminomethyl(34) synthesis GTPase MnmE n=1 Tax=Devosia enhydra TaxID=665118 RepID=UPI001FCE14F2|nr:tRNA uridine-5-carboxymethylaminomethyl(34) synthesis GTPase MnmE [Devosia enhydra]